MSSQSSRPSNLHPANAAKSLIGDIGKGVFWIVILRAVLAVLFGILLLTAPALILKAVGIYVGIWLIIDGILSIVNAFTAKKAQRQWGWEFAGGIAYAVVGLVIIISPFTFALASGIVILWMMAFGMLARGVTELLAKSLNGWMKVLGVIDIVFAIFMMVMLFSNPAAAVGALIWIVGIYTVMFGIFIIVFAVKLRMDAKRLADAAA